ncbi:PREDICTED: CAP-Gly domain-containing linker protein 1-like [Branchiostoma belcheri]|uniref:CAP-Gly domain-containing linker protein 1-like n=1 Tax=Branchiostoma belcheri TaxID=7741 RepID=A0A6P4Y687_BRABE|nr:PREDICTED: CAP-Gly domain-containing linker protein 1-like [Branchiostoma belcheri]
MQKDMDAMTAGDPITAKLRKEKEEAEGQTKEIRLKIDFLNSVIVDLQRKNDELIRRIDQLESGVNGEDLFDEEEERLRQLPPPRLYCDICDVFDEHDTDDCPKQATEFEEYASHSQYHGDIHTMYIRNIQGFPPVRSVL